MTRSGLERANSSRNWRESCDPRTARYVSSHSSVGGAIGGVRGNVGCWGTGGGAVGCDACCAAMFVGNHDGCIAPGGGGGGFADGLGFGVANTIAARAAGTKTLSNFIVGG